ncbi:MAG: hypothetical protein ABF526_12030 [Liquorilactobacillus nagelii]|uniref:hypothetical protein n=1 Tax=Liquorilactobacillus nagelii TaxID=82688 RepID=UPI0039EA21A0
MKATQFSINEFELILIYVLLKLSVFENINVLFCVFFGPDDIEYFEFRLDRNNFSLDVLLDFIEFSKNRKVFF